MTERLKSEEDIKNSIASAFGNAAESYERYAELQKNTANRLIASLRPWRDILPPGPIVELGCGTGFVTKKLAELYPARKIIAIDLSQEMIEASRRKLGHHDNLAFKQLDAETATHEKPEYAMTISGFTAQWFKDPALTLGRWLEATKPGGLLLASFPGSESFPEWKRHCRELGLPFTGNRLPDTEEMIIKLSGGPSRIDYHEDTVTRTFDSAFDFFKQLKRIGAGTRKEGRPLSPKELSLLIGHWDRSSPNGVRVSYHIVFLAVKKVLNS